MIDPNTGRTAICYVTGCNEIATTTYEVPLSIRYGQTLPICDRHRHADYRNKLWFYRGQLFEKT